MDDRIGLIAPFTGRMTEAALARPVLPVKNHIVIVIRAWAHGHCVEMKLMPNLPGDDVIGA
jgi:hypothetical protein